MLYYYYYIPFSGGKGFAFASDIASLVVVVILLMIPGDWKQALPPGMNFPAIWSVWRTEIIIPKWGRPAEGGSVSLLSSKQADCFAATPSQPGICLIGVLFDE